MSEIGKVVGRADIGFHKTERVNPPEEFAEHGIFPDLQDTVEKALEDTPIPPVPGRDLETEVRRVVVFAKK